MTFALNNSGRAIPNQTHLNKCKVIAVVVYDLLSDNECIFSCVLYFRASKKFVIWRPTTIIDVDTLLSYDELNLWNVLYLMLLLEECCGLTIEPSFKNNVVIE
jgi:hypothetical protein